MNLIKRYPLILLLIVLCLLLLTLRCGVAEGYSSGLPSGYHTEYEGGTLLYCWDGQRDEVLDKIKEVDERRYVLARTDESNIYRVEMCVKRRGT